MRINQLKHLNHIILDTGPLFLLLTLHYETITNNKDKYNNVKKSYDKLDNIPDAINKLEKYFRNINTIYTTPHVIGELNGLVNSRLGLKKEDKKSDFFHFWEVSIKFLKQKSFNEKLISIIELYDSSFQPLIQKIGFVDTELIKLAYQEKIPILTFDKRTLNNEVEKLNNQVNKEKVDLLSKDKINIDKQTDKINVGIIILDEDLFRYFN